MYDKEHLEFILYILILAGSLNWLAIGVTNTNIVQTIFRSWSPLIYILVGVSGLYFMTKRDYFLPFLAKTHLPCSEMVEKIPENANIAVPVTVTPNSNVIFWAADEAADDPWTAYNKYTNAGLVRSDANGIAVLRVRQPQPYSVMNGIKTLRPHIHYRVCSTDGFASRVETVEL